MKESALDRALAVEATAIEAALAERLRSDGAAARLDAAMRYATLGGGKRLRAILCLWVSDAAGGPRSDAVWRAACALEMIHAYSLVHDDLPAMDDDDWRRGRPSCHRQFDEATAILAGDTLQTEAFACLARISEPALALSLVRELATAAGRSGMAAGQQLDLDASGGGVTSEEDLLTLHRLKTGCLLGASIAMGAICAGHPASGVEAARRAGQDLGLAFQAIDDVLDATASPQVLGKSVGKDLAQGKFTAVRLWGIEATRARAHRWLERARTALREADLLDERVDALAIRLVDRGH